MKANLLINQLFISGNYIIPTNTQDNFKYIKILFWLGCSHEVTVMNLRDRIKLQSVLHDTKTLFTKQ